MNSLEIMSKSQKSQIYIYIYIYIFVPRKFSDLKKFTEIAKLKCLNDFKIKRSKVS